MGKFFLKYRLHFYLVIIGLAWIIIMTELMQLHRQDFIFPDSDNYRESASYLYHHFKAHYFRPLGLATLSGLPYLFGGNDVTVYQFSFVVNLLCWLGSGLLVFSFCRKLVSDTKAFGCSLVYYSVLGSVFIIFHLLTESIVTFLVLLSFWLLQKHYQTRSFRYLSIAISLLLFGILIKPGLKFLSIVLILFFIKTLAKNWKKRSAAFIYLALALIAFQCIKMKQDYGNYTITYIDGVTYYNYLGSKAALYTTNDTLNPSNNTRAHHLATMPFPEQKTLAGNDMAYQLKHNSLNLLKGYISNLSSNARSASPSINVCYNVEGKSYFEPLKKALLVISKYQNRFFTIIGFILALYYLAKARKNPDLYSLMGVYILYVIAVSGISCCEGDRFHIVFFPFVIILMAKLYTGKLAKNKITN